MADLIDRRVCRCAGMTNPHCPSHGTRGLRIGIDVHASACVVKHDDTVLVCRCGLTTCSGIDCVDEARRTLETADGLYRVCGEHHLLFDLDMLNVRGEVGADVR